MPRLQQRRATCVIPFRPRRLCRSRSRGLMRGWPAEPNENQFSGCEIAARRTGARSADGIYASFLILCRRLHRRRGDDGKDARSVWEGISRTWPAIIAKVDQRRTRFVACSLLHPFAVCEGRAAAAAAATPKVYLCRLFLCLFWLGAVAASSFGASATYATRGTRPPIGLCGTLTSLRGERSASNGVVI